MGEQAAVGGERKKRRDEEESYAGEKRLSRHTCAPQGSSDNTTVRPETTSDNRGFECIIPERASRGLDYSFVKRVAVKPGDINKVSLYIERQMPQKYPKKAVLSIVLLKW